MAVVAFAFTSGAVVWSGLVPTLPWGMVFLIGLVGFPFALCLTHLTRLERARGEGSRIGWPACLAISAAILLGWHYYIVWPLIALALGALSPTRARVEHRTIASLAAVVLTCGYGVVWNLNYLLERHMPDLRWDPLLRELDLRVYRWWLGPDVSLAGLFPLVSHPVGLRMLDNAYAILVAEVILVAYLLSQESPADVLGFLRRLFGFYLAGIAIFVCFPVNGPHLYFPEQQDLSRSLPATVAFANGMMHDFKVAKVGGQLRGYGYFIAVPSLHVLVAIYLQHVLRSYGVLFRVFLPVNVLLCASTVLLGYHYLADVVAAIAVYAVALAWLGAPSTTLSAARQPTPA